MFNEEECKMMIDLYIEAEKTVLTGKRYRIGTRELERADLSEIRAGLSQWMDRLKIAQNGGRKRKIRGFIPRDL